MTRIVVTDVAEAEIGTDDSEDWVLLCNESQVVRQTELAIHARDGGDFDGFVPKSVCCMDSSSRMIYVKVWFATKNGIG